MNLTWKREPERLANKREIICEVPELLMEILEHDFTVGGRKHLCFGPVGEPPYHEDCRFEDIVTNERIVFSMTVSSGAGRLTASMVTVEFSSLDSGTRVQMTEQIAILDGGDSSEDRRKGWNEVFDKLELEI